MLQMFLSGTVFLKFIQWVFSNIHKSRENSIMDSNKSIPKLCLRFYVYFKMLYISQTKEVIIWLFLQGSVLGIMSILKGHWKTGGRFSKS